MNTYTGDLHIHSVLSPCGQLEMSPANIIEAARHRELNVIGLADHNSTLNAVVTRNLGAEEGILVLMGAEVATREEVHCLTFFEDEERLLLFQQYLEQHYSPIPNRPDIFGHQCVVDAEENILDEVEYYLVAGISQTVQQVAGYVRSLDGLFIPAHINRPSMSLISQLGFIPEGLTADAWEAYRYSRPGVLQEEHPPLRGKTIIRSSDAHSLDQVGAVTTNYHMKELSFNEIRMTLAGTGGRSVSL